MANLFTSSEFWAAVIGGLFTLAGTMISLSMQSYLQRKERSRVALSFFEDQIAHFRSISEQIEIHFNSKGEIWYEYVDNINSSYNIVSRNVEHLTFVSTKEEKRNIRNYFSDIYYMCQQAKFYQDKFYEIQRKIGALSTDLLDERAALTNEQRLVAQNMKDRVLELKRVTLNTPRLS